MNWMFWARNDGQARKLPGPQEIPQSVGSYLVTKEKMDPDQVWSLMAVRVPRSDDKHLFDVRIYSQNRSASKGVTVKDYHSLDGHPDLVIFDGWYNKQTHITGKRDA